MKIAGRRMGAFTLLELLIVMTVIGVLAALVIAATATARRKRDETVALSNIRQVGIGFQLYAAEHDGALPSRAEKTDKWPRLISHYLNEPRVLAYVGDEKSYLATGQDPFSNSRNNTSFIYNGFDDLGTYDNPDIGVRAASFDSRETIILGIPVSGDGNFYMDFEEGNQKNVLNLTAFGEGAHYLFVDGSTRYILKEEYIRPVNGQRYGDTLWLANRSYQIP